MTWRKLLTKHGPSFLKWLERNNERIQALDKIATELENFIIKRLSSPEICEEFWRMIPEVRCACNKNAMYEKPLAVEAYAYVHLLDRYWRTWDALEHLTQKHALPLGQYGIRVFDIGTGPAPTPYAIVDYYKLLQKFGESKDIEEFQQQHIEVDTVELSKAMCRFMNHFSEFSSRPGPFGSTFQDFAEVNLWWERILYREYWPSV